MTTEEVKAKIGEERWDEFLKFMSGQTVGGTPDKPQWYEDDVHRFMNGLPVID